MAALVRRRGGSGRASGPCERLRASGARDTRHLRERQMTTSAAEQLSRILRIIPEIADGEEHDITAVSLSLGIERDMLLSDLRAIGERYGLPGGFVEGMEIYIGATTISARSDQFLRPMGLTMPELKALELGLTVLEQERPPDDRPVIDSARQRLRKLIAHLPIEDYVHEVRTAEMVP